MGYVSNITSWRHIKPEFDRWNTLHTKYLTEYPDEQKYNGRYQVMLLIPFVVSTQQSYGYPPDNGESIKETSVYWFRIKLFIINRIHSIV